MRKKDIMKWRKSYYDIPGETSKPPDTPQTYFYKTPKQLEAQKKADKERQKLIPKEIKVMMKKHGNKYNYTDMWLVYKFDGKRYVRRTKK